MIYVVDNQTSISICPEFECATIEDVFNYCIDKKELGLDIETTKKYGKYKNEGLDPRLSKIIMLQIGDETNQFVIDTRSVDISSIKEIFTTNAKLIGHNLKFEYKHLLHAYGVKIDNLYDTMIADQVIYNGLKKKFSLQACIYRHLGIDIDKEIRLNFLNIGSRPFNTAEVKYGAMDIVYPMQIMRIQETLIKQQDIFPAIDLEMKFIQVLGDIEYHGINFNKSVWLATHEKNYKNYVDYLVILNNFVIDNYFNTKFVDKQLSLFESGLTCAIEWSSSKQVVEFFKHLGFCPKVSSKKSGYSVEAVELNKTLNQLTDETHIKLVKNYLTFKEYEQCITTFGKDFLKYVHPITQRIHSDYRQILNTGRISSSSPNLQNIPREESFRSAFDTPEDYCIINADYSGQESVILANRSQDTGMIDFYLNGDGDLHSYTATQMYRIIDGDPNLIVTKKTYPDKRQNAKSMNFALAYGASAFSLQHTLKVSEDKAQEFIDIYFKAFPGLNDYFNKCKKSALKNGYIIIDEVTKRRWFFPFYPDMLQAKQDKDWQTFFKLKGSLERNSQNYPIQGTAGSITKLATILFRKYIQDNKLTDKVFITNIIHDEINVECHNSVSENVAKNLETCMRKAGEKWCKTIKLDATAVISNHWQH